MNDSVYYVTIDALAASPKEAVQNFIELLKDALANGYADIVVEIDHSATAEIEHQQYEAQAADRFDQKFDV